MKLKIPKKLKGKLKGRKIKVLFIVSLLFVASYLYFARPQFGEGVYGDYTVTLPVLADLTVVNLQAGQTFGGQTAVSVGSVRLDISTLMISFLFYEWQRPTFGENTTIHSIDLWYLQEDILALERQGGDLSSVCPIYIPFIEDTTTYAGRPRVPVEALQYCSPLTPIDLSMAWFSWNMTQMMASAFGGRVVTMPAVNVTNVSATLNGQLTSMGGRDNVEIYFQYGPSLLPALKTPPMSFNSSRLGDNFAFALTGLTPSTTYNYYAVIQSEGQVFRDLEGFQTFVTPAEGSINVSPPPEPPVDPPIEPIIPELPPGVEPESIRQFSTHEFGGAGDDFDPDSVNETNTGKGPGDPVVGAVMFSLSGHHIFASEDHNRPERRPYVTYSYTGPRILSPAEAGQVWVWSFMAAVAAPLAIVVLVLGRRYGRALMFHYKQQYDGDAAKWLFRVNQWQYDARDFGVFGEEEDGDKMKEDK